MAKSVNNREIYAVEKYMEALMKNKTSPNSGLMCCTLSTRWSMALAIDIMHGLGLSKEMNP